MTPEEALEREGLVLPTRAPAVTTTRTWARSVRVGSLIFVAGDGPFVGGKIASVGKLGADVNVDEGRKAAELVMMNILGTLKAELGEFSRISRFVRLLVFVNATPDFSDHHRVAQGATDLLVKIFGEIGRPALSEVGVASLPFNGSVEIEAVVEIRTQSEHKAFERRSQCAASSNSQWASFVRRVESIRSPEEGFVRP